jgi:hypothetical protein
MDSDLHCTSSSSLHNDRNAAAAVLIEIFDLAGSSDQSAIAALELDGRVRTGWDRIVSIDDGEIKSAYEFILHYIADLDIMARDERYKQKMTDHLWNHVDRLK